MIREDLQGHDWSTKVLDLPDSEQANAIALKFKGHNPGMEGFLVYFIATNSNLIAKLLGDQGFAAQVANAQRQADNTHVGV